MQATEPKLDLRYQRSRKYKVAFKLFFSPEVRLFRMIRKKSIFIII